MSTKYPHAQLAQWLQNDPENPVIVNDDGSVKRSMNSYERNAAQRWINDTPNRKQREIAAQVNRRAEARKRKLEAVEREARERSERNADKLARVARSIKPGTGIAYPDRQPDVRSAMDVWSGMTDEQRRNWMLASSLLRGDS